MLGQESWKLYLDCAKLAVRMSDSHVIMPSCEI
jgi:hypothetical protein